MDFAKSKNEVQNLTMRNLSTHAPTCSIDKAKARPISASVTHYTFNRDVMAMQTDGRIRRETKNCVEV